MPDVKARALDAIMDAATGRASATTVFAALVGVCFLLGAHVLATHRRIAVVLRIARLLAALTALLLGIDSHGWAILAALFVLIGATVFDALRRRPGQCHGPTPPGGNADDSTRVRKSSLPTSSAQRLQLPGRVEVASPVRSYRTNMCQPHPGRNP